ncbi:Cytochrome C oxidase, cbb3-type, subunit III [Cupriavidus sp. YR651]|uniref:c-type cytochrome n=1 Tax=Cupriavidus sp. YR651 TaxID=1855315 RepID=UPI0008844596|nr:c-type cytochrome [Cupriavidus sp. YR651]SDD16926.1 Cytochrome C oxidase, cbb3-type, subunit III [Cupriavidus sp. YR651]
MTDMLRRTIRRLPMSLVAAAGAAPMLALAQPAASGPVSDQRTTVETQAARMQQARNQAAACAVCHGPDGRAPADSAVPGLAGRPQVELVESMLNYKSGKRPGTVMPQIAKGYSDAEIIAIASWFADQK